MRRLFDGGVDFADSPIGAGVFGDDFLQNGRISGIGSAEGRIEQSEPGW
jgi:hypothetical protein